MVDPSGLDADKYVCPRGEIIEFYQEAHETALGLAVAIESELEEWLMADGAQTRRLGKRPP
jgi:hypothetical protein